MRVVVIVVVVGGLPGCTEALVPADTVFGLPVEDSFADDRPDIAPGPGEGRLYVTNNLDDTVSVFDVDAVGTDDFRVIATVPLGFIPVAREGPHHVAVHPDGDHYYVGISNFVPGSGSGPHGIHGNGTADGHAFKISVDTNLVVAEARVDPSPGDIRLTPDGRLLLMSHFDLVKIIDSVQQDDPTLAVARLAVIDADTMERRAIVPLCPGAHGIAVSHDGTAAYVSCVSDELAVVDLTDPTFPVTRVPVIDAPGTAEAPVCYPYATAVSPDDKVVLVSCYQTGELRWYDVDAGVIDAARSPALPGLAVFGSFIDDGARFIATHQDTDGITVVSMAIGEIERVVITENQCVKPHFARPTEDGSLWLVVCEGDHSGPGAVAVIEPQSGEIVQSVPVGRFPDDLALFRRAP
jgi:YVTN family beta-propeller protein